MALYYSKVKITIRIYGTAHENIIAVNFLNGKSL
jgi:hypothetical protein